MRSCFAVVEESYEYETEIQNPSIHFLPPFIADYINTVPVLPVSFGGYEYYARGMREF
jgi:hypothetical protein